MAFTFPADKLVATPAADGADTERSRKSKSRKARRAARGEARFFQSYAMVVMDDLEDKMKAHNQTRSLRRRDATLRGGSSTTWNPLQTIRD